MLPIGPTLARFLALVLLKAFSLILDPGTHRVVPELLLVKVCFLIVALEVLVLQLTEEEHCKLVLPLLNV